MNKNGNKFLILLFILFFLINKIGADNIINHCENGKREIFLNNNQSITLSCIDCKEGEYTSYNEEEKKFECKKCQSGSSNYKNDILINNFLDENLLSKYSFESFCSIQDDSCPKWTSYIFSIKVKYIETSFKSFFKFKQYFMNNGELIVKYINYNGGINKLFNIYVNGKLSFTDDSNDNIQKTKYVDVKKGENIFIFEYLVNEEIKSKNSGTENDSFLEIFEITMKNAEISALNCNKFDSIEKLFKNLLNNCQFDVTKCSLSEDNCTDRFYSEIKKDYCIEQEDVFYQEIEYKKINNAKCKELITPPAENILCKHCSYGQFTDILADQNNTKTCFYCQNDTFNSKEINDNNSCDEICDENKQLEKILYINNFDDSSYFFKKNIEIIQPVGNIIINYEKFNVQENTIFFIEIDSNNPLKLIDPNYNDINSSYSFFIPLTNGTHSLKIKGSNLKLSKIIIKGSTEGGNFNCLDKVNLNDEKVCEKNEEYFSKFQNKCLNCPLGTAINKNKNCQIFNQIISNVFTLDNNDINVNIFSTNYELDSKDVKYYFNLNPTNPLIYYVNNNNSSNIQIIGNELKNIKIVKGIEERGIILSFISEEEKNSYFYIKCNPFLSKEEKTQIILKNIEKKEENGTTISNYFFLIESNTSCPYCLTSEANITDLTECEEGLKKVNATINDTAFCVVKPFSEDENLKLKDDSTILLSNGTTDTEEQMILKNFEITEEIPINYENKNDELITDYQLYLKCKVDISHRIFIVGIILLCFGIIIIGGLVAITIWKIIDNKNKKNRRLQKNKIETELGAISSNGD